VRQRALLALSLPLILVGCLGGHAAGYALAGSAHRDAAVHGYLAYAPQFVAACVTVLAVGLAMRTAGRLRGRLAAWPFALLPALAFLTQETVERAAAGVPGQDLLAPPVYVGLAAQLPVAVLAYLVARALIRAADTAGLALARGRMLAAHPLTIAISVTTDDVAASLPVLGRRGRAPPRR
jgi:hypothetical protein